MAAPKPDAKAAPPGSNQQDDRGRSADWPSEIPQRGWWDILKRVAGDLSAKNLSLIAAGAAFYAFLAIPSAITALVSIYGLLRDPADIEQQVQAMQGAMPSEAAGLIAQQLKALVSHSTALGVGFVLSLAVALWSASSGTTSIIQALNIVNDEREKRGFVKFYATALAMTAGLVLFAVVAIVLIAVLPAVLDRLPFGNAGKTIATVVRWPILLVLMMVALSVIYRFAPSRDEPKWRWVSWGAVAAALLWLAGSALFSVYVGQFASYNKTYGSLGAVVVLLMWLWLSAYAVVIGGQLNAEIEHQTARDSTEGAEQPLGRRGARMADTLGREEAG